MFEIAEVNVSKSKARTFKNAAYGHLAEVGKALSSPARLEILELLAQAPRTVEVLAGEIDQSVANTSHHLQALKRAQLVTTERDGSCSANPAPAHRTMSDDRIANQNRK